MDSFTHKNIYFPASFTLNYRKNNLNLKKNLFVFISTPKHLYSFESTT